jgi:sugar phosphate permease
MWILPMLFFTFQFILRLWPGLMMHQIMDQLSIDAGDFGLLAASYYYGYAGMSIPMAILLDRFGARYVVFLSAILCGIATLMFTYTDSFCIALLSRGLIGAGSAVGFLGVSKVVSEWFPKDQYARMIGLSFTFGLLGAIYGGKPVSLLIESNDWQDIAQLFAIVSIVIGCASYAFLRAPKAVDSIDAQAPSQKASFRAVLSSPIVWWLAVSNLLMVGSLEGFADVWGITYLTKAYDLNKSDAAGLVSLVFFGMLFGGPVLAWFSKKIGEYSVIVGSGIIMASTFVILFSCPTYSGMLLSTMFFVLGIMCCYQVIVFSAGANLVAPHNLGITVAFLNCINMLGGSFFHTAIGKTMDLFWTGSLVEGVKAYDLEAYKYAISVVPACALIGTAIVAGIAVSRKRISLPVNA